MKMESLKDLYVHELNDLHSAEQQIIEALPKMAGKASNPELRRAFEEHLQVTKEQVRRLETIFDELGAGPSGQKCRGMEGLIEEGEELLEEEDADPATRDAGLIAAAQRVEHYEIAGYGCARTYAARLGFDRAAQLLQQTLDEEGMTDERLTALAERVINPQAESGEGERPR
jgi:ferritin-like metal-binding protein YciE